MINHNIPVEAGFLDCQFLAGIVGEESKNENRGRSPGHDKLLAI